MIEWMLQMSEDRRANVDDLRTHPQIARML